MMTAIILRLRRWLRRQLPGHDLERLAHHLDRQRRKNGRKEPG